MSMLSIAPFFPFCRARLTELIRNPQLFIAALVVTPDQRFTPVCSHCGKTVSAVHSQHYKIIRDLPMCQTHIYLLKSCVKRYCR